MPEFMDKPSSRYSEAIEVLTTLIGEENLDSAERAFAEAVSKEREKLFHSGEGAKQESPSNAIVSKFLGKKRDNHWFPGWDHVSTLVKNGEPAALLSQPYGLSTKDLEGLLEFCKEYNLDTVIRAKESWHFPGYSLLMKFTKKED